MFRFKAHVSLTYIVKVFMSIQPAIVLTIISCSTPSSHQVSLRSFLFCFLSRKPSKSNLTVIYKVKDHILILKKLSGLMFVMPKMILKKGNRNYASLCHE